MTAGSHRELRSDGALVAIRAKGSDQVRIGRVVRPARSCSDSTVRIRWVATGTSELVRIADLERVARLTRGRGLRSVHEDVRTMATSPACGGESAPASSPEIPELDASAAGASPVTDLGSCSSGLDCGPSVATDLLATASRPGADGQKGQA